MLLDKLQTDATKALKNKDKFRRSVLSDMIAAVQKATITPKGKIEPDEKLVNEVLIKYQKTIQEMIDTCPSGRSDLLEEYQKKMEIVKEYAPQMVTDRGAIKGLIITILNNENIKPSMENKNAIMKSVMPKLKGQCDMKIANQVLMEVLSE